MIKANVGAMGVSIVFGDYLILAQSVWSLLAMLDIRPSVTIHPAQQIAHSAQKFQNLPPKNHFSCPFKTSLNSYIKIT